jgi:hypothetical protein
MLFALSIIDRRVPDTGVGPPSMNIPYSPVCVPEDIVPEEVNPTNHVPDAGVVRVMELSNTYEELVVLVEVADCALVFVIVLAADAHVSVAGLLPSVRKNCPEVPTPSGNRNVDVVVTDVGDAIAM